MNDHLFELLNKIPAGWLILILISFIALIVWITKRVSFFLAKHKEYVLRENEEQRHTEELNNSLKKLTGIVEDLKKELDEIRNDARDSNQESKERFETLSQDFDDFKKLSQDHDTKLSKQFDEIDLVVKGIGDQVKLLISSDKEAIEVYITNEYHKWMERQEIDITALEMVEKRISQYNAEHGETFLEKLVEDMRALPKTHSPEHLG